MNEIAGSLLWLTMNTRPDKCEAVARLCQTVAAPTTDDFKKAGKLLRYLAGSVNLGLMFYKPTHAKYLPLELEGYGDSDWAGDVKDAKSQTGFIHRLGASPISWGSRKQSVVALSTAEAELVAAVDAAKEILWLRSVLGEIGEINLDKATVMFCDNTAAIALGSKSVISKRTRHINIRLHCINEWCLSGQIKLEKIHTDENLADLFTKAMHRDRFAKLIKAMVA